jgi:quercetin dioxygenase-like cupin family protein
MDRRLPQSTPDPFRLIYTLHIPISARVIWEPAMQPTEFYAINTLQQPWEERFNEKLGRALFRKMLYTDPESGMEIRLVCYPAGIINPLHTHPCGHGMYVLDGQLVTHKGTFGPGHFVWFPEGEAMEHGASAGGDVIVLFITNKSFRIDYID